MRSSHLSSWPQRPATIIASLAILLFTAPLPAVAQQSLPGDACSIDGSFIQSTGPETAGAVHFMVCSGGQWQSAISFSSTGLLTTIGNQTCSHTAILKYDGAKWACSADAGANVPGNHREILFNNNGALAADPSLVFASSGALAAASVSLSGGVKIGDVSSCDASAVGTIRYSTVDTVEYCADNDGSPAWKSIAPGGGLPAGAVIAFNSVACPTGWTEVTDLRGRFVVGVGTLGSDTYALGDMGGEARHTLSIAELAAHTHPVDPPSTSTSSAGNHSHSYVNRNYENDFGSGGVYGARSSNTSQTGAAGAHTHTVNIAAFNSGSAGSGTPHENRPPYKAYVFCESSGSGAAIALADLGDVDVVGVGDNKCLIYNASITKWEDGDCAAAASGDNLGDHVATQDIDMATNRITNLSDPATAQDAATKTYVDATVPSGAVMTFDLTTCPSGWSEYQAARGRFVRGIDNGAGNDPDGTRAPGNVQAEDWKSFSMLSENNSSGYAHDLYMGKNFSYTGTRFFGGYWSNPNSGIRIKWDNSEFRPENVALLYCRKD